MHCHVQGNYQLVIDNLLDLSHLATVHASTVGSMHVANMANVETDRDGDRVKVSRWTMDVPAAKTYQQFGQYESNIDRWQISEFFPPSYFRINNGSAVAGSGARDGTGENPWDFWVCHGVTPSTEDSTHYFWHLGHKLWSDNMDEVEEFYRQCYDVVGEDIAVFEAQQKNINLDPSAPMMEIGYDAGSPPRSPNHRPPARGRSRGKVRKSGLGRGFHLAPPGRERIMMGVVCLLSSAHPTAR